MKYTALIIIGFLFFQVSKCQQLKNEKEYLFQKWWHNNENDKDDVQTFRPEGFNLPPSRGRTGIEFKKDGTFINYDISPADGTLIETGHWETKNNNLREIFIRYKKNKIEKTGIIKIKFLSKDKLQCIIHLE